MLNSAIASNVVYGELSAVSQTEHTETSYSTSPRLEIDTLDTLPFSQSFSGLIVLDELSQDVLPERHASTNINTSYHVERLTNLRDLVPVWDHSEIEEIMVISPKTRHKTAEAFEHRQNAKFIDISDFEFLYVLGVGTTAIVNLVQKRDADQLYAVKSLRKAILHEEGCVAHARSEQTCLKMITQMDLPFLPKLQWSFQDQECLYLVMDFYPGGDLLTALTRENVFRPNRALFYASEIAEGIAALHSAGIIHRDLKPENVMIDARGHIVLTDFGCAKVIDTRLRRATSACGTREYQAPEMLLGWAHDFSVDCWGFGLLLYIMLYGRHPFAGRDGPGDHSALRSKIVDGPTPFHPLRYVDLDARDLITKCLERNAIVRLDIQQIKAHNYFSSMDWKRVATKEILVPFVPALDSNRIDLSYFDREVTGIAVESLPAPSTAFTSFGAQQKSDVFPGFSYSRGAEDTQELNNGSRRSSTHPISEFVQLLSTQGPYQPQPGRRYSNVISEIIEEETPNDFCFSTEPFNDPDSCSPVDDCHMRLSSGREAFWDNISIDHDSPSCSAKDFVTLISTPPLPRKLRKRRSSLLSSSTSRDACSATPGYIPYLHVRNKLRKKHLSTPALSLSHAHPLNLPRGISQIGNGIGYTFSTSSLAAPRMSASKRLTALPTRLGQGMRNAKHRLSQGFWSRQHATAENNPELDGSFWDFGMSPVDLSSPLAHAADDSPWTTYSLLTSDANVEEDGATAGGPDTTLRLIPSLSGLCIT